MKSVLTCAVTVAVFGIAAVVGSRPEHRGPARGTEGRDSRCRPGRERT